MSDGIQTFSERNAVYANPAAGKWIDATNALSIICIVSQTAAAGTYTLNQGNTAAGGGTKPVQYWDDTASPPAMVTAALTTPATAGIYVLQFDPAYLDQANGFHFIQMVGTLATILVLPARHDPPGTLDANFNLVRYDDVQGVLNALGGVVVT